MLKNLMPCGVGVGLVLSLFSCAEKPAENQTAMEPAAAAQDQSANQKWVSLLPDSTLSGWHTYGRSGAGQAWQVIDGVLSFDPARASDKSQRGDLVTNQEYGDFHLKLEWKISEGGNSGIIFYINEDTTQYKNTYETGLEMQVLDNAKHPDAKIHKHRAGDLYDLIASTPETVKPAGEWNQAEIVSKDGQLDYFLNGEKVVSATLWDDAWKQMVANSKFKQWPGFGTFKKGHIALQDHDDKVWYRNIQIKEL